MNLFRLDRSNQFIIIVAIIIISFADVNADSGTIDIHTVRARTIIKNIVDFSFSFLCITKCISFSRFHPFIDSSRICFGDIGSILALLGKPLARLRGKGRRWTALIFLRFLLLTRHSTTARD